MQSSKRFSLLYGTGSSSPERLHVLSKNFFLSMKEPQKTASIPHTLNQPETSVKDPRGQSLRNYEIVLLEAKSESEQQVIDNDARSFASGPEILCLGSLQVENFEALFQGKGGHNHIIIIICSDQHHTCSEGT